MIRLGLPALANKVFTAGFRSVISVSKTYQLRMRRSGSRKGKPRTSNQRVGAAGAAYPHRRGPFRTPPLYTAIACGRPLNDTSRFVGYRAGQAGGPGNLVLRDWDRYRGPCASRVFIRVCVNAAHGTDSYLSIVNTIVQLFCLRTSGVIASWQAIQSDRPSKRISERNSQ